MERKTEKTIFYEWVAAKNGRFTFEYWSKPGRTDKLRATVFTPSEGSVRKEIESTTGIKRYRLEQVKA